MADYAYRSGSSGVMHHTAGALEASRNYPSGIRATGRANSRRNLVSRSPTRHGLRTSLPSKLWRTPPSFLEQMQRLAGYRVRALVVEASCDELAAGAYRSNMNPRLVTGTLQALVVDRGIPVLLVGSAREASEAVERMLVRVARNGMEVAAA